MKKSSIGHSEGGTIALMLAAENKADFIVSLAGMVVSGKETLLWQNRVYLAAAGIPAETIDSYCKALETVFDASTAGMPLPSASQFDLPTALSQNLSAVMRQLSMPYLKHFCDAGRSPAAGRHQLPRTGPEWDQGHAGGSRE